MNVRQFALGTTLGLFALTVAGSATAGEWQALKGLAAAPMTPAQMEAVQGKAVQGVLDLSAYTPQNNATYLASIFGGTYSNSMTSAGPIYSAPLSGGDSTYTMTFIVGQ